MKCAAQWVMNNPEWIAIFTATLIAELAIGKTKKLESNSIIGLIFNIILRRKL